MKEKFKSNRHVVYSNKYHLVFCPKYRRKVLTPKIIRRFKKIARDLAKEKDVEILEMEIVLDHVHMIVEIDPQRGIHKWVKLLKGKTSRILREEFKELRSKLPTLWTHSYFVSTIGGAPLEKIKEYVENQKNV